MVLNKTCDLSRAHNFARVAPRHESKITVQSLHFLIDRIDYISMARIVLVAEEATHHDDLSGADGGYERVFTR